MQPLFLTSAPEFTKTAAYTQLPEDPNAWPHEILQELYKQAPYIADFSPHVVMEKVDGEKGYGLGHVEVGNQTEVQTAASPDAMQAAGLRHVRVPVVVKDGMLCPFDLLVTEDSKVLPLTEARLRAAIFRPQAFDVTSRTPGDQSMIGQLYPPYRQAQGFGGGGGLTTNMGMGKEGSSLESFLTEKTAGPFQDFGDQFLSEDYLHGATERQGRVGKKVASGNLESGSFTDFVEKNASAMKGVMNAIPRGAATIGAKATQNTAAAKGSATAAMVRAKNLAAKIKKASLLELIRPSIYDSHLDEFRHAIVSDELQPLLHKNAAAVTPALQLLLDTQEQQKTASILDIINPTVVQLKRVDDGYRLKTASHLYWQPITQTIDRANALHRFGEKIVLAADLSGAVTLVDGADAVEPEHDSDMQAAAPITEAGLYKVQTPDGEEAIGYVIPNLLDIDGTAIPLSLFTNGTQATVQGDVVGVPVEGAGVDLPSADAPSGRGVFASEGAGGLQATVPLTIEGSMAGLGEGEPMVYRAESFTGEQVLISIQPNIQTVTGTEDGKMLVPEGWQWVPLTQADEIALESQEDGLGKAASARMAFPHVEVVSAGGATYSVRGSAVEKLAHDDRELLGLDDVMFLLAGLGVEQGYGVRKLAAASTGKEPVKVCVGRQLKLASDQDAEAHERAREILASMPQLRQPLWKEAAALSDPQSVDAVLALGFINPENLTTFIGYLPLLEDAQSKLCDVLLASRLGSLIETPEGAVERAVRSTEAVLEGLKALAFQQN